jgi:hypothetical protein
MADMHTKDILAKALREAGLEEMAKRAEEAYYHDFLSPLDFPEMRLAADLAAIGTPAAMALRERHMNGEFDASKEESDEWAKSAEGQEVFGRLVTDSHKERDSGMTEKYWRALKPDAQPFDEVRITTIPRFKESELSGSEWRISAKVELLRNGVVMVDETYRDVETAARFLPSVIASAGDDGKAFFGGEGDVCDQEGCKETATVTYLKKHDYCDAGHKSQPTHPTIRRFCERHKVRGDCGLDDADSNYTPIVEGDRAP